MAANMALKRAAKANRRKAIVAEKRKTEPIGNSPITQVLRAAQAPIRHCVISQALFHCGLGTVILARGVTTFDLAVSGFLIDAWGRGVKDAYFRRISGDTFESWLAGLDAESPLDPVDPSYARKLLRDAAAWAAVTQRIAPHREFAVAERLFGDVNADACDTTFQFGLPGARAALADPVGKSAAIALDTDNDAAPIDTENRCDLVVP
jgi:hypothetical protein